MPMTNKPNIAKRIDKVVKMIWLSLPKLIFIGKSSTVGLVCISGNNSTPFQIAKRKKAISERLNKNFSKKLAVEKKFLKFPERSSIDSMGPRSNKSKSAGSGMAPADSE